MLDDRVVRVKVTGISRVSKASLKVEHDISMHGAVGSEVFLIQSCEARVSVVCQKNHCL